jgi:LysR family transcriptional regulator, cys regulon transcriptional activator
MAEPMTLRQLRYLYEVFRHDLNITRAAQSLGVSQPGLSRQLQLLEQELNVELFVRNRKRLVRLTPAGVQIVPIAQRTLDDAHAIREAAREHAGEHHGALTIATTHTQARYALPAVLRRFMQRYPAVQLNLRQGTPSEVSALVASGNADLSIATEPLEPLPEVLLLPCYQLQRIVLTPPKHPLLKTKPVTLEALATYPLITYDFAFIGRSKVLRAFDAKGLHPNIVMNAIDADVIKTYVEFGLGIAILPAMAYERRRDRSLRALDASHLFEPNTIHLGIRRNHYLRGYMFAFIEMFAPHLKRDVMEKAITEAATRRTMT